MQDDQEKKPLWQRLGWLLLIWSASVLALGLVAGLLRLFMQAAGMGTP
jgi:type III secretory pathway component EscS